jgi:hypothetical protein
MLWWRSAVFADATSTSWHFSLQALLLLLMLCRT